MHRHYRRGCNGPMAVHGGVSVEGCSCVSYHYCHFIGINLLTRHEKEERVMFMVVCGEDCWGMVDQGVLNTTSGRGCNWRLSDCGVGKRKLRGAVVPREAEVNSDVAKKNVD